MKTCSKCLVEKPLTEFYLRTDGRSRAECKACAEISSAAWHKANPDKVKKAKAKWILENPDKMRKARKIWQVNNRQRQNDLCAKWQMAHPEYRKKNNAKWTKNNLAWCVAKNMRRHAAKLNAVPEWANHFFISEIYDLARLRTKHLGIKHSVDHIVPLQSALVCGLHVECNLRVIPHVENISKSNRTWPDMP